MAQYLADGIQRAIDNDPAISLAEGKAIHALLRGRTRPASGPEVVQQMREWIEDCGEDTSGRERPDIVEAVRRNYDGGIKQFLLDGLPEPEEPTR